MISRVLFAELGLNWSKAGQVGGLLSQRIASWLFFAFSFDGIAGIPGSEDRALGVDVKGGLVVVVTAVSGWYLIVRRTGRGE